MKNCIFVSLLFFASVKITAQSDSALDSVFTYKVPFYVPDNPAFKALDIDPSNILRPTDIKSFAFTIAPYVTQQGFSLPRNFALEFSPGRTASKYWTVQEYSESTFKRFAYNFSFNMATKFDNSGEEDPFKLSLGAHYHWTMKEDNPIFNKELYIKQSERFSSQRTLVVAFLGSINQPPTTSAIRQIESPQNNVDSVLLNNFKQWVNGSTFPTQLDSVKKVYNLSQFNVTLDAYEAKHWNDFSLDFAFAWVGQAGDSTLKDVGYNFINAWTTVAFRPWKGSTHSQILIGGFYRNSINADSLGIKSTATGNFRFYYGDQTVRGFAEAQYKWNNYSDDNAVNPMRSSLLLNLGLEAKVGKKFSIFASGGIENFFEKDIDPWSKLRSSVNLRYFLN